MESLPEVETGVVGLHNTDRLLAFVVPTLNRKTMSVENSGKQDQHAHSATKTPEGLRVSSGTLEKDVLRGLSQIVPSHSVPDTVLIVPALPLTNHGKVAMEKLMKMYEKQGEVNGKHTDTGDVEIIREKLQALWKECIGLCDDGVVADNAHFMLCGGDSLQAMRLFDYIKVTMATASEGLLEVILDGSFSDILKHITAAHQNPVKKLNKRLSEDSPSVVLSKKRYQPADLGFNTKGIVPPVGSSEGGKRKFLVVRRAGDVVFQDCFPNRELVANTKEESDNMDRVQEEYPSLAHSLLPIDKTNLTVTSGSPVQPTDIQVLSGDRLKPLNLQVRWSSDTGKCVDASPVVLVGSKRVTVFIGSHSHRLQALDLSTGEVVWERVLGNRLESSAVVSRCGTMVALGCYDGQVYFLSVDSGETRWVFQTGDAVKSSPAVDLQTGLVIVGSHDGHVYALEPLESGTVLWTYSTDTPFFSSPSCCDYCVCVGSVNGHITALSHDGNMLWDFLTDGPVFSSPCLSSPPSTQSMSPSCPAVFCGSHDSFVYCISSANGSLLWRFQTTGKVYSSPFVFDGSPWGIRTLVAIASTDGTLWVLNGEQGTLEASFSLPGELFSSPVVWGHAIVVGCRNDYLYCLEISRKE
ncbi:Acyl-CoA synthetase family member 4 [Bagarius yarrelli]|uniref:Acyl-CoA synthetase family member 4 n=1 Tax=Bagarius yarrelli TaxID=175774 RepID=A0A556U6N0_BAGYA|nr:Acyl-CoA synthetase family member 4 [Bagarius yarrelli]